MMSIPTHRSERENQKAMSKPMPKPDPEPLKKTSDAVTALAALYQGEKTDTSYIFNTAMVMMGVAVTYVVGAIPFVGNLSRPAITTSALASSEVAWLFLLLLPIPLWLIAAFHSLITLNAMTHGISVRIIEDELFKASELPTNKRTLVGSLAGDRIMDITQAKVAHKITTVIVYAGVAFLVIGFTVYSLHSADEVVRRSVELANVPVLRIAIAVYSLLLGVVALSWIAGFRTINKGRAEIRSVDASAG